MSELVPAHVGPYIPQQLIALGAQAQVWLATGPEGDVALKVARTESAHASIKREADILREGTHPHLVRLVDAAPDGAWLATERLYGVSVDQWCRERDSGAVIDVALQIVSAVEFLHDAGIVHGDLKPSNVLVSETGVATLIDLGVATLPGEAVTGFRGTLGYAAPELLKNEQPSPRTDMYGLGALLYTCVTGRTPFVAPDPAALTYLPLVSLPAPPAAFRPDLPGSLNQLLLALLTRRPDRRPKTLVRVRTMLRQARQSLPSPPILGMLAEREQLRRAVVGAADGEPRVVVLYGPPGSGRRTLIAEAVEYARREGLPYLKGSDAKRALQSLRSATRPSVLVMRGASKSGRQLAQLALKEGLRCLLLLHCERPLPQLTQAGAIQLTPSPLTEQDAVRLARMWGADSDQVDIWWRQSMGLPIAVVGRVRAWRREQGKTQSHHADLPAESRKIYESLRGHTAMRCDVVSLAQELKMTEHTLLDHCEVLFAEDLLEAADDGAALAVVRSRSVQ